MRKLKWVSEGSKMNYKLNLESQAQPLEWSWGIATIDESQVEALV